MTPMSAKRSENDPATDPEVEPAYRSLVERVPAIVYVDPADPEPTAPSNVSPFIETMLGYPPEVATGDGGWWASALHPDDRERVLAEWVPQRRVGRTVLRRVSPARSGRTHRLDPRRGRAPRDPEGHRWHWQA